MSRSFTQALHATAFTTLAAGLLITVALQVEWPRAILWPAFIALIPPAAVLVVVGRSRTAFFSAAYLFVGGVSAYWFTLTVMSQLPEGDPMIRTLESLPSVALFLVGGSGVGVVAGFGWTTAGYLIGSIATTIARWQLGFRAELDIVTSSLYLSTVLILVLVWFTSRTEKRATRGLTRATGDELAAQVRWRVQSRSAALLHDTVLSHLTAMADAPDRIPEEMRAQMRRDLDEVLDEGWLDAAAAPAATGATLEDSPVLAAVRAAGVLGLDIDLTGDLDALTLLGGHQQEQLALAVTQILVNVLKHSGVRDAEVSISGADDELLVMIIDTGRGFVESEVPSDRLGLRGSIRGRIAELGGAVQVWSTVGRGTSVILRVPLDISTADVAGITSAEVDS